MLVSIGILVILVLGWIAIFSWQLYEHVKHEKRMNEIFDDLDLVIAKLMNQTVSSKDKKWATNNPFFTQNPMNHRRDKDSPDMPVQNLSDPIVANFGQMVFFDG